jgi:peptide/nickel transport system substrate-binding protein
MKPGRLIFVATVLLAAIALVAVGSTEAASTLRAKTPKDTLVIAASATPVTLDFDFGGSPETWEIDVGTQDRIWAAQVKTLVGGYLEYDYSKPLVCLLCESWSRSPDGRKITVTLKKGVKSSFGNELTTGDIQWSFERSKALQAGGLFIMAITSTARDNSVTLRDKYSFDINLTGPNPLFPLVNAVPLIFLPVFDSTEVKKHATASDPWAKEWVATHTASFGPYHVQTFTPGVEIVMVANPNYHIKGKPSLKKVIWRQVPEPSVRAALLVRGEVDIALELPPRLREEVRKTPGIVIEAHAGNNAVIWMLNNNVAPLNNVKIRRAIAFAAPVDDIVKTVFLNDPTVRVAQGYYPEYYLGGPATEWPYKRDVAKAKQLLREAGVRPFSFRVIYDVARPGLQEITTILKTRLKDIDIDLILDPQSPAKFQEEYQTKKADSAMIIDSPAVPEAGYSLGTFLGPPPHGVANRANYNNSQAFDLLLRALDVPVFGEERFRLTRRVHDIMVSEAPWVFYLLVGYHLPRWANVKGFVWGTGNWVQFVNLQKD